MLLHYSSIAISVSASAQNTTTMRKLRLKATFRDATSRITLRYVLMAMILGALSACTSPSAQYSYADDSATLKACRASLNRFNSNVERLQRHDSQSVVHPLFPYLRYNRFLAGFSTESLGIEASDDLINRMATLANTALTIEAKNSGQASLALLTCQKLLLQTDFNATQRQHNLQRLLSGLKPHDEYQRWKRIAGVYWITAFGVKTGAKRLEEDIINAYRQPLNFARSVRFDPPRLSNTSQVVAHNLKRSPLGIPLIDAVQRQALLTAYAPSIIVEQASHNDLIGTLHWQPTHDAVQVDTQQPSVYQYLSFARYKGQILRQLNYVFWFPARPKTGLLDILGGHLDGLTWRVTLNDDGQVVLYDSIHNCGCYHLFYATDRSCIAAEQAPLQEAAIAPQTLSAAAKPALLYLSHSDHYLQRVSFRPLLTNKGQQQKRVYSQHSYDTLRSLATTDGDYKSIFQGNGIVKGTQRLERFLLWPMGIPGPGEMRQQGHQATAFFGKRHFDDANLLDRYLGQKQQDQCISPINADDSHQGQ